MEIAYGDKTHRIGAGFEVILSLGVIRTPSCSCNQGFSDQAELQRLGIPLVQHLPGVGKNFQDHVRSACIWEYQEPLSPRNNAGEATFFWKSNPSLSTPDIQTVQVEVPLFSAETEARFKPPPRFLDPVTKRIGIDRGQLTESHSIAELICKSNPWPDPARFDTLRGHYTKTPQSFGMRADHAITLMLEAPPKTFPVLSGMELH